jgi:hypothetical protein
MDKFHFISDSPEKFQERRQVFLGQEMEIRGTSPRPVGGCDPAALRILERANIGFVCLANNHIMDFGERGLLDPGDPDR